LHYLLIIILVTSNGNLVNDTIVTNSLFECVAKEKKILARDNIQEYTLCVAQGIK